MFAISRWPGPNVASRQESEKDALSLQALNARARERAALRFQQQSLVGVSPKSSEPAVEAAAKGNEHSRVAAGGNGNVLKDEVQKVSKKEKKKKGKESQVAIDGSGSELKNDVQTGSKKEKKKRKKKRKEGEDTEKSENGGEALGGEVSRPNAHIDAKKNRKDKGSLQMSLAKSDPVVDSELLKEGSSHVRGSNVPDDGSLPEGKIRKKKRRRDAEKQISKDQNVENPAAAEDVSVPPAPSLDCPSSGKDSDAKREGLSERENVDAADMPTELRRRKKGGAGGKLTKSDNVERADGENCCAADFPAVTRKGRERGSDTLLKGIDHSRDGRDFHQEIEDLPGKLDLEASDHSREPKKKKEREVSAASDSAEGLHKQNEGLSGKGFVDADEPPPKTEKKKRKRVVIAVATAQDDISPAVDLDVDKTDESSMLERKKKRKLALETHEAEANDSPGTDLDLRETSERFEPADPSAETKSNKRGKAAIESREEDGVTAVEDIAGVSNNESADSVDFSRIQRDVDRIMGQAPSQSSLDGQKKRQPVLPWMREPLEIDLQNVLPLGQVPELDIRLQDALRATGIQYLFQVQVAVWNETVGPGRCEQDLCVCSPTGSGKTLAYALPIVQKLSTRVLRRLRALVVLPTRDLAVQVKGVFDTIAPSVGLKVGLAVGQTSVVAEAAELVKCRERPIHCFGGFEDSSDFAESCVDILVATPGRLMDHLHNTKQFTLEHLLYLVVDETDRLLRQSYQDWLPNVLKAVAATECRDSLLSSASLGLSSSLVQPLRTIRYMGAERGTLNTAHPRLMKLILSATLTRDPSKIAQLALHRPMYIAQSTLDTRYQLPEQLQAYRLICKSGEKPLFLAALLQQLGSEQTIVFTASVVATHRLYLLLSFFEGLSFKAVEYSSLQHQQARSKSLAKFRDGEVQVLVASDAMTRGMDVESVANVINYDMPVYAKTYVHRVGRTARAGRVGKSFTILRREEVRHFKSLLKKADNSLCKDYKLPVTSTEELNEQYLTALEKLKEVTREESASKTPTARAKEKDGMRVRSTEEVISGPDELFM